MDFSNKYILGFALAVCLVCSLAVSSLAVVLDERIDTNKKLDQQVNILRVAGLVGAEEKPDRERAAELFHGIAALRVSRDSGEVIEEIEFGSYDMFKAAKDPATSRPTSGEDARGAQIAATPNDLIVYHVTVEGHECWVLPIWGNGLWSTMKGFLALEPDLVTVRGITYAEHGETPGLGGEVDNPMWKARWPGKQLWGADGSVAVDVVKAGTVKDAAHQVDGISGATITSVAVGASLRVWLGEQGYGKFLQRSRPEVSR